MKLLPSTSVVRLFGLISQAVPHPRAFWKKCSPLGRGVLVVSSLLAIVVAVLPFTTTAPEPDAEHPMTLVLPVVTGCTAGTLVAAMTGKDSPFNQPGLLFRTAPSDGECFGSYDILDRIHHGLLTMGPVQENALRDYDRRFPGKVKAVDRVFEQAMILIVRDTCGPGSLEDIAKRYAKERRRFTIMSRFRDGSRGFQDLTAVLDYHGFVTPQIELESYEKAAEMFERGLSDAVFLLTSEDYYLARRLARMEGARVMSINPPPLLVAKDSGMKVKIIKAGNFGPQQTEPVKTLATACLWAVGKDVPSSVLSAFRTCLHSNQPSLKHQAPFLKLKDDYVPPHSLQPRGLYEDPPPSGLWERWTTSLRQLLRGGIQSLVALDPLTKALGSAISLALALIGVYNLRKISPPPLAPSPSAGPPAPEEPSSGPPTEPPFPPAPAADSMRKPAREAAAKLGTKVTTPAAQSASSSVTPLPR